MRQVVAFNQEAAWSMGRVGAEPLNSAPGAEEGSLCQCRDL